jgi:hypothetical protein
MRWDERLEWDQQQEHRALQMQRHHGRQKIQAKVHMRHLAARDWLQLPSLWRKRQPERL